jgi:hypothetical protein
MMKQKGMEMPADISQADRDYCEQRLADILADQGLEECFRKEMLTKIDGKDYIVVDVWADEPGTL